MRCTHHNYVINTPGRSCYLLKCSNIHSKVEPSTADVQRMELHGHQAIQRNYTGEKECWSTLSRSRCRCRSRHRCTTTGSVSRCGCASVHSRSPPTNGMCNDHRLRQSQPLSIIGRSQAMRRTRVSAATSDSLTV